MTIYPICKQNRRHLLYHVLSTGINESKPGGLDVCAECFLSDDQSVWSKITKELCKK